MIAKSNCTSSTCRIIAGNVWAISPRFVQNHPIEDHPVSPLRQEVERSLISDMA
jgi:hypothetical protein